MFRARRRTTVSVVLFAIAVVGVASTAAAGEHLRSQVHTNLWYYWPQRYIDYYIQDTRGDALNVGPGRPLTSDDIAIAAADGFTEWSRQKCTDLKFIYRGNVATRDSNMTTENTNGYNTIIFRYDDWDGTECQDAIACTTVVTKRAAGEIIDADIDLNLQEYEFVLQPIDGSPAFDLQSVLTHEIGHMIGLDHTQADHSDAVMWPYADWGEDGTRHNLTQDDIDTMCEVYPAGGCPVINEARQPYCGPADLGGCTGTGAGCSAVGSDDDVLGGWMGAVGGLLVLGLISLGGRRRRG